MDHRFNDWAFVTMILFYFSSLHHLELSLAGDVIKGMKTGTLFFFFFSKWKYLTGKTGRKTKIHGAANEHLQKTYNHGMNLNGL